MHDSAPHDRRDRGDEQHASDGEGETEPSLRRVCRNAGVNGCVGVGRPEEILCWFRCCERWQRKALEKRGKSRGRSIERPRLLQRRVRLSNQALLQRRFRVLYTSRGAAVPHPRLERLPLRR
jgi:hypothetical protein